MENAGFESIIVTADNGVSMPFLGRLFSESSYFDEDTSSLVRLRLYATDTGSQVYYIVRSKDGVKSKSFYRVKISGEMCEICDGIQTINLNTDMLFSAVFGLCGVDPEQMGDIKTSVEEAFAMASSL